MHYSTIESVWLATAIMAYEVYNSNDSVTLKEMYFKQADIKRRAHQLTTNNVDAARISQWANADHENNSNNYLRVGLRTTRRLTFVGEFGGIKEAPFLNREELVNTSLGERTVGDIYDFVAKEYTGLFKIDFISVLNYLQLYGDKPYKNPEDRIGEEKEKLLQIKATGSAAAEELNNLAKLCESKFNIKNKGKSKWLNGGNDKVRAYLWNQLKFESKWDYPSSISLFAELKGEKARLRVAVELDEKAASAEDYKRHHRFLDEDILNNDSGLFYFAKRSELDTHIELQDTSAEVVKKGLLEGIYEKVQLTYVLTHEQIIETSLTNDQILADLLTAVNNLLPFYKLATDYEELKSVEDTISYGENNMGNSSKNMILYGPPGTGKTYNTVNYAVSIIENKSIGEVRLEGYEDVFERYNTYKKQGQVGFITFHQSYGYEEFIEGIKPVLNEDQGENITYKVESGMFKEFCENAQQIKITSGNEEFSVDARVWKVSLGGSGMNYVKADCFTNNRIRIGWDDFGEDLTDSENYPSGKVKDILYSFYDDMSIGDIVFSLGDQKHIDAIGIITGETEWLQDEEEYKRSRPVKWIAKNIEENIFDLNGKKNLTLRTIYELKRLSLEDVHELILKYSQSLEANVDIEENRNNYVFIIDEINRGNISKIFGELITLIEPTKRIGADEETKVKLPYSKKEFGVPQNVYIIGTMNTADRSIALMDTALRRRFNFIEMMPNSEVLDGVMADSINIQQMVETMNKRIEVLYDREHTIGHAYFMSLKEDTSIWNLAKIFQNTIIPLLQEYFYEDYSKIQLVLGDNAKAKEFQFIVDEQIKVNDLFKGNPDIDLPEQKYRIQSSAFMKPQSYIGIYE